MDLRHVAIILDAGSRCVESNDLAEALRSMRDQAVRLYRGEFPPLALHDGPAGSASVSGEDRIQAMFREVAARADSGGK